MDISSSTRNQVKSAARVLDILEFLSGLPAGATLSQIARHLEIPSSSLHNLVMTLVRRGYLSRDHHSMEYRLGPKLGQISNTYHKQVDLSQLADPYMVRLTRQSGETTSLSVLQGDEILFIHKVIGVGVVQVVNPVGTRLAAHATGAGKVILAFLPEQEIDQIFPAEQLPQLTPYTIRTKTELKQALAGIRQCGFAFDDQESNLGIWAAAACIREHQGYPVAALSLASLVTRMKPGDPSRLTTAITETAGEISTRMDFHPSETNVHSIDKAGEGRIRSVG